MLHRRLRHPERQAAVDGRAKRSLGNEAAIDADDRNRPEVAAAVNRLTQHVRTVAAEICGSLHLVDDGIEACRRMRFSADSVDASICAAPIGEVLDLPVDIVLHKI